MTGWSFTQSSNVTGCQVLCQVKSPAGTVLAGVPTFAPNVKRCVN